LVVENASAIGPVSVKADCFEESVAFLEQEMVINELLSLGFSHVVQRVIGTGKVASEALESLNNVLFNLNSLLIGNSRS
jgi:hypothetical protein